MLVGRSWRVVLCVVAAALVLSASRVHAQSIVDARRVEFTPSVDHNTLITAGAPMVERYTIEVFVAGSEWPVTSASLGKPNPEPDGMIRVDFVSLLPVTLQSGVTYEAVVEAVGPGGRSGGMRTGTFSFGGAPCAPVAGIPTVSFPSAGGTGTSTVTTAAGCVWNATTTVSWITITSGASGTGPGSVAFSVAENTSTTNRSGTLTVAGTAFTITQSGVSCTYAISPSSQSFTAAGGTGSSGVTAPAGCGWSASSNNSWITVASGTSGTGPGSVSFSVAANTSTSAGRTGTLTIAGRTFTVTQANASCSYSISSSAQSFAAAGGSGGTSVTAGSGCTWSATSTASWITVTSGASGTGAGSVGFSVAANTSTTSRSGTLTIAGATFTVSQAGAACTYSATPASQTFGSDGGSGSSTVTAGAGCAWTATSNAPWISLVTGATGSGSGSVAFDVAAYTGSATRSGTLTIAGTTLTVIQTAPNACSFSLSSTAMWFTSDGGFSNSVVTAPAACAWDANSNVAWIAVINAGPGKGTGAVSFIVATNSSANGRTGTLTVAGSTITVTQSGSGCTYSTSPTGQAFGKDGGTGITAVTTASGCGWAASSNANWISIGSGSNGSGSGSVTFTVAPHTGSASRTGTLTIAGTTFTITQASATSCTTSISPSSRSFTSDGGFGNSTVTAAQACPWGAASNAPWIALINAGPGQGTGSITFIVATNSSGANRSGTITVAGKIFTVTQSATSTCTYAVAPGALSVRASATSSNISVTTQGGCSWTSSGAPDWLTMSGGGSGTGSVTLAITANTTTTARSATLTIAGVSFSVTQSGRLGAPVNLRVVK